MCWQSSCNSKHVHPRKRTWQQKTNQLKMNLPLKSVFIYWRVSLLEGNIESPKKSRPSGISECTLQYFKPFELMNLVALPFAFTASAVAFNKRFSCGESFLDRPRKIKKCPEGQWKKSWNFALPWYTHCYTTWHGITWCHRWKLNMPRCSVPVSPWHIYAMLWCSSPWCVPKFARSKIGIHLRILKRIPGGTKKHPLGPAIHETCAKTGPD